MLPRASFYDVYEAYDVFVKDQVGVLLGGTQKYFFENGNVTHLS